MTPPRDVQDYEAQARELLDAIKYNFIVLEDVARVAAALRAAGNAALERAAQVADRDNSSTGRDISEKIRALIAPAPGSQPASDYDPITAPIPEGDMNGPHGPLPDPPRWRIGRHYGIHVYCGDTPIATFHTVENARAAVRTYNASLDRSEPAPSKEPPP